MPGDDFQLTVPTLRYQPARLRLLPDLLLNPPAISLSELGVQYPDLIRQLRDPVFMAMLLRREFERDQYRRMLAYAPSGSPNRPYMPSLNLVADASPEAVSTTLSAVMAVPQVQLWLGTLQTDLARGLGVSNTGLRNIGIVLATTVAGTGIVLYETGRVSSLPAVTIPFGALNVQVNYRKSFMINLEFQF